jgi:hypothetical protein
LFTISSCWNPTQTLADALDKAGQCAPSLVLHSTMRYLHYRTTIIRCIWLKCLGMGAFLMLSVTGLCVPTPSCHTSAIPTPQVLTGVYCHQRIGCPIFDEASQTYRLHLLSFSHKKKICPLDIWFYKNFTCLWNVPPLTNCPAAGASTAPLKVRHWLQTEASCVPTGYNLTIFARDGPGSSPKQHLTCNLHYSCKKLVKYFKNFFLRY